jgi:hypothetical protein
VLSAARLALHKSCGRKITLQCGRRQQHRILAGKYYQANAYDLTFFAADGSGRHVPSNTSNYFKPRLFRQHNPARRESPRKAVDVFPRTIAHIKIQGFPVPPPPKSTFSAGGKSPENPVFKPFFRRLFVFYI